MSYCNTGDFCYTGSIVKDKDMKKELKDILEELNDTMEDVIALVDRIAKHDGNLYEELYKHASEFEHMVFTELHD